MGWHARRLHRAVLGMFLLMSLGYSVALCGGVQRRMIMDSLTQSWGDCAGKPCVTLRVRYPLYSAPLPNGGVDSLNHFIQETLLGKFDRRGVAPVLSAVLDTLVGQFRALPANNPHLPWTIERAIDVIGDTLGTITFDVMEFRFTGGAHPTTMHLLYIVEPSSMRILTLDDLIAPAQHGRVRALAEQAFRKARNLKPEESVSTAGFTFPEGRFELTMNVGLTHGGLLFYYNPYEIAPYVMGPTAVVVPWKDLGGIIKLTPSP